MNPLDPLCPTGFTHKTRLDSLYGPGGLSKVEGPDLARCGALWELAGMCAGQLHSTTVDVWPAECTARRASLAHSATLASAPPPMSTPRLTSVHSNRSALPACQLHNGPCRFKFLLNLDGYTAAYRLSKLMLTGAVFVFTPTPIVLDPPSFCLCLARLTFAFHQARPKNLCPQAAWFSRSTPCAGSITTGPCAILCTTCQCSGQCSALCPGAFPLDAGVALGNEMAARYMCCLYCCGSG